MTVDKLKELLVKATPGPWFSVRENVSSRGPHVCKCYRNDLSLSADCNAALIALAPQLAAALIEAIEGLDNLSRLGNGDKPGNSDGNVIARATLSRIDAIMEGKG